MAIDLPLALLWYLSFVVSTTAHEAAHALAAYVGGDPTAYRAGQVTLNPVPHMRREPFGMILIPILGLLSSGWCLGWASTPYDPRWEERYPRRAAWMAAAGPGANLAIAVLALLLMRVGLEAGFFFPPSHVNFSRLVAGDTPFVDGAGSLLSVLLTLNTILFLFNLIPFPPLDGASAIRLVIPEDLALRFAAMVRGTPLGLFGLFGCWYLFGSVIGPVFSILLALVHPGLAYG